MSSKELNRRQRRAHENKKTNIRQAKSTSCFAVRPSVDLWLVFRDQHCARPSRTSPGRRRFVGTCSWRRTTSITRRCRTRSTTGLRRSIAKCLGIDLIQLHNDMDRLLANCVVMVLCLNISYKIGRICADEI